MKHIHVGIVAAALAVSCRAEISSEEYKCLDASGQPIAGALIVCSYGLPNRSTDGIDFRASDATGIARFGMDDPFTKAMDPSLRRAIWLVYSAKTHTGYPGAGRFYNRMIDTMPDADVVRENATNVIVFKDGSDDPVRWHRSLLVLMKTRGLIRERKYGWGGRGIEAVEVKIEDLAISERSLFLTKFGAHEVPADYLKSFRQGLPSSGEDVVNFSAITPELR